jgi:hypothetical protein
MPSQSITPASLVFRDESFSPSFAVEQAALHVGGGLRFHSLVCCAMQVGDLKKQLEQFKQSDSVIDFGDADGDELLTQRIATRAADDKQKEKLKQMEQKRREAQEVLCYFAV